MAETTISQEAEINQEDYTEATPGEEVAQGLRYQRFVENREIRKITLMMNNPEFEKAVKKLCHRDIAAQSDEVQQSHVAE